MTIKTLRRLTLYFISITIVFFYPTEVRADEWLCTSAAAIRNDNIIVTCGVATAPDEGQARLAAFRNAKQEFREFCEDSEDCKRSSHSMSPLRSTCEAIP